MDFKQLLHGEDKTPKKDGGKVLTISEELELFKSNKESAENKEAVLELVSEKKNEQTCPPKDVEDADGDDEMEEKKKASKMKKEEKEPEKDKDKKDDEDDDTPIEEANVDVANIIKTLGDTDWHKDNESQMKAVQLLKGIALSDDPKANEFMTKLSNASTSIAKAVLKEDVEEEAEPISESSTYSEASEILDGAAMGTVRAKKSALVDGANDLF